MRKAITLLSLSLFILTVGSCSKEAENGDNVAIKSKRLFTVSDARRVFDENSSLTRSQDDVDVLTIGYFDPQWDAGVESSDGKYLNNVDVPVESEYVYRRVRYDDNGEMILTYIHHKMVVVQGIESGQSYPYILFYLPSDAYAQSHSQDVYPDFLNGNKKGDFTGLTIYTTLDGSPVCTGRYDNGELEESAFLNDSTQTIQYNYAKMIDMLDEVVVAKCERSPGGVTYDTVGLTGDIDGVVILGKPNKKTTTPPYKYVQEDDPGAGGGGGGGCGGTGGTSNGDTSSPVPNLPTKDAIVIDELEKLLEDCMGQLLMSSINRRIEIITGALAGHNAYIHSDNNTLTQSRIELINIKDYILLEEIIHAYQYQGTSIADYNSRKLNNEVEAKLGWYMYRERIGQTEDLERALGGRKGVDAFRTMSEEFDTRGIRFESSYYDAAQALRTIKGYSDSNKYPLAKNDYNVKKLMELMKNCLEKE